MKFLCVLYYDPTTGNEDSGTPLRKNLAGPGMIYDRAKDAFYIDTGNKSEEFVLQKALKFIKSF